jgi:pimeloyl-ACP methyl ester carboxylesterase
MESVTSKDGTTIVYDRSGNGPAVILVGGATVTRHDQAPLATELAAHFAVYNYDRRGRGESDDTLPYALEREIEDIEALIAAAGGSAYLYGISSGGGLVLEAAAAGVAAGKIAVYEVPYDMLPGGDERYREYNETLTALLAEGRRGDAFALFMRFAGASEENVEGARNSPMWAGLEALAPTLAYDAACLGNGRPNAERLAKITQPALIAIGGASADSFIGGGGNFFEAAADAVAESIPHAQRESIEGQTHMVDPKALAPVLTSFFKD